MLEACRFCGQGLRRYNAAPMSERIRGRTLQRIRMRFLIDNPYCVHCEAKGLLHVFAAEVDHKLPLHQGGEDVPNNRQGLCKACHLIKSKTERGHRVKPRVGLDGYPVVEAGALNDRGEGQL